MQTDKAQALIDKEEKLEAIRAIRTQLEGYWEKPIQALKNKRIFSFPPPYYPRGF